MEMIITDNSKMDILGRMGEKYVANHLTKNGIIVEQAISHFDSKKDLTANGKTVEVKTQVPFLSQKCFSFKKQSNNLRKCRSVDELYFISVKCDDTRWPYNHNGWLFKIDPKNFKTKDFTTKDGRDMILIPIYQEAVTPILKIEDNIMLEMMKYSVSKV